MKYTLFIFSFLILIISSNSAIGDNNYIINDDTVYIDDSKVYLSATPHTLSSSGWVYFNLTSKVYTGNIDACWGFNTSVSKPTKAELYSPYWVNTTTNHQKIFYNSTHAVYTGDDLDYGNFYNTNYKYTITESIVNENGTTYITSNAAFDSYTTDGTNYTIYWHTRHDNYYLWKDFSSSFNSIIYNYEGYNKWYYIKNILIISDKEYTVRAWIDVPVSTQKQSGKYYFAIKPSHETISQAINNEHFYNLDPWWNATWSNRKNITLIGHKNITKILTPAEDGFINNETGVGYIKYSTWDSIYAKVSSDGLDIGRGYVEWDISSIPDDAIITNAIFKYEGGNNYNNVDCNITQIINKPSISGNHVIYDNIGDGIIYVDEIEFPQVGFNQEINLGNNAIINLESALSSNWFAIGIILKNETKKDSFFTIVSDDYAPTATPKPTLYVEYTSASEGGNNQTDYQLLLNVTYESEMQSDFDDLRFCNETHEIDAWLESKVDTSYAHVWVEFPTTPANGVNQTYYMYYGNAGANYWDGAATFIQYQENLTTSYLGTLEFVGNHAFFGDITPSTTSIKAELGFASLLEHKPDNGAWIYFYPVAGETTAENKKDNAYTGTNIGTYSAEKHRVEILYNSGVDIKFYYDDVLKATHGTNLPTANMGMFFYEYLGDSTLHFGAIRKYTTNPPTYVFGSSEEHYTPPTPTTIANETKLIMSEITAGLKSINMGDYLVYAFILIGILLIILGIQIITNNIYRG